MDEKNCLDTGFARDESEREITTITDFSVAQQSVQISIDVEKATRNATADAHQQPALEAPASHQNNIVDWNSPDDPENPQNWSGRKKWTIIILVSVVTFNQYAFRPAFTNTAC